MLSRIISYIVLICLVAFPLYSISEAKPSIDLELYKNNGYGVGNDIGGVWTITASVSSDVEYVEFYLDDQLQKNDTSKPFDWQFDTADYPVGSHSIKAVAYNSMGDSSFLQITRNFQEASTESVFTIIIAATIAIVIAAIGFALYKSRKK